jgi:predicted membrane-bound spermidine synthase
VSGFTGLIYESIWSHYLRLFLGHAAYAQALVLVIFMGGMAIGAWLASRWVHRLSNLLIVYAIVEVFIGLFGIGFNPTFQYITTISYDIVIPALDSPVVVHLYKWTLAIILILPQSILLGTTFPLMSNGIIRRFPNTPGKSLSMLYFTNSLGAAIGVIISGFILIAAVGLPGTILFAGLVNIALAIIVYGLAKNQSAPTYPQTDASLPLVPKLLLSAAFITGVASFIYEIAWLRMLSMVLGASTHSFELMLSAFITGLAFGGLWIRRRIDRLTDPLRFAGIIQIAMGTLALATLLLYNHSFDLMGYFMAAINRNEDGYYLFNLASHFIALLIMLPATFCAGMTLPLFTYILLKRGHGEKSIGQIYASNTLGAIIGVAFAIFIGMPLLGLKGTMLIGCVLDMGLGLILLAQVIPYRSKQISVTGIACILSLGVVMVFFEFDVQRMSSGIYRGTSLAEAKDNKILFQKDGKTASIHVIRHPDGTTSILTNGKSDASIMMTDDGKYSMDESTEVLLAALPLSIKPDARTVANIGMGSGLTTHTLLAWPGIERIDTIEIEPAVIEGSQFFRPRVERTYTDPRSHIYIEDAKTFFFAQKKKYDLIISEPSNPWVSGTSSLFTDEFYRYIKNNLEEDGMLVQWLQAYEINTQLIFTVLNALKNNFSDCVLYAVNDYDILILAQDNHPIEQPRDIIFSTDAMRDGLAHVNINNIQDLKVRFIANNQILEALITVLDPAVNSDYFPILDLNAFRLRFIEDNAFGLTLLRLVSIPLIDMLKSDRNEKHVTDVSIDPMFSTSRKIYQAQQLYDYIGNNPVNGSEDFDYSGIELLIRLAESCKVTDRPKLWINELYALTTAILPYLTSNELKEFWDAITPGCNNGLNEDQHNWLNLLIALSDHNYELIADYSTILFEQEDRWNLSQRQFQFESLLISLIQLKDYKTASDIWVQHINKLYQGKSIPLHLLILYGLTVNNVTDNKPDSKSAFINK